MREKKKRKENTQYLDDRRKTEDWEEGEMKQSKN